MIHGSLIFGPLQAFLKACYTPDNLPLRSFPGSVANFSSMLKQVKVRGTSKELRPVATPQPSASSSVMANGCFPGMSDMMDKIEQQAGALDALQNQMALTSKTSLPRPSSTNSLGSGTASPMSSLMSPKALPSVEEPLPLPAPPAHGAKESCEPVWGSCNTGSHGTKSLEDYEQEAKERHCKKTAKEMDAKMPVLKRPSSKKATKAEDKVKVTQKKKAFMKGQDKHVSSAFLKGIYGCIRCRGNTKGCDTCRSSDFGGLRFSSREEYNKWYQKKQQCGTKRK